MTTTVFFLCTFGLALIGLFAQWWTCTYHDAKPWPIVRVNLPKLNRHGFLLLILTILFTAGVLYSNYRQGVEADTKQDRLDKKLDKAQDVASSEMRARERIEVDLRTARKALDDFKNLTIQNSNSEVELRLWHSAVSTLVDICFLKSQIYLDNLMAQSIGLQLSQDIRDSSPDKNAVAVRHHLEEMFFEHHAAWHNQLKQEIPAADILLRAFGVDTTKNNFAGGLMDALATYSQSAKISLRNDQTGEMEPLQSSSALALVKYSQAFQDMILRVTRFAVEEEYIKRLSSLHTTDAFRWSATQPIDSAELLRVLAVFSPTSQASSDPTKGK